MKLRVVLVRPEGSENIGSIARGMANFGFSDLVIVEPKAEHYNGAARSRAMHAKELLKKAKVVSSIKEAMNGVDYSVATTSKVTPSHRLSRTAFSARSFAEEYAKSDAKVAVVFGPEANGLRNEDIAMFDFIIEVPTSSKYRAMNLSHACTVVFYELFIAAKDKKNAGFEVAPVRIKEQMVSRFGELADESKGLKNKKATVDVFRRFVSRAPATEREANAILAVFSGVLSRLKELK